MVLVASTPSETSDILPNPDLTPGEARLFADTMEGKGIGMTEEMEIIVDKLQAHAALREGSPEHK